MMGDSKKLYLLAEFRNYQQHHEGCIIIHKKILENELEFELEQIFEKSVQSREMQRDFTYYVLEVGTREVENTSTYFFSMQ